MGFRNCYIKSISSRILKRSCLVINSSHQPKSFKKLYLCLHRLLVQTLLLMGSKVFLNFDINFLELRFCPNLLFLQVLQWLHRKNVLLFLFKLLFASFSKLPLQSPMHLLVLALRKVSNLNILCLLTFCPEFSMSQIFWISFLFCQCFSEYRDPS